MQKIKGLNQERESLLGKLLQTDRTNNQQTDIREVTLPTGTSILVDLNDMCIQDYGGVTMLHVPSDHIWRPDIVLYNKSVIVLYIKSVIVLYDK